MKARVGALLTAAGVAAGIVAGTAGQATMAAPSTVQIVQVSTAKPSGYCSKKELGQKRKYTTPSKKTSYYLTCKKATTQKWQK